MTLIAYIGPLLLPIAPDSELNAAVWSEAGKTFVTVGGPCGLHHTMSVVEAERLKVWLEANLPKRPAVAWPDVT